MLLILKSNCPCSFLHASSYTRINLFQYCVVSDIVCNPVTWASCKQSLILHPSRITKYMACYWVYLHGNNITTHRELHLCDYYTQPAQLPKPEVRSATATPHPKASTQLLFLSRFCLRHCCQVTVRCHLPTYIFETLDRSDLVGATNLIVNLQDVLRCQQCDAAFLDKVTSSAPFCCSILPAAQLCRTSFGLECHLI